MYSKINKMQKYKYLDIIFLTNLKNDTYAANPRLVPELFDIYFNTFSNNIQLLEEAVQKQDDDKIFKTSHYMKGQSACVGLVFYSKKFLQIETDSRNKKCNTIEAESVISEIKTHYSNLKLEVMSYLKTI
jgi:hypothetical protein